MRATRFRPGLIYSTGQDQDERAREGVRDLAIDGIVAGEAGAAGVGGLIELLAGSWASSMHDFLNIGRSTRVLVLATEGATDPAAYARTVGQVAVAMSYLITAHLSCPSTSSQRNQPAFCRSPPAALRSARACRTMAASSTVSSHSIRAS